MCSSLSPQGPVPHMDKRPTFCVVQEHVAKDGRS
jgi:hypothetical protein